MATPMHIDQKLLDTDLMYRFEYVCKFINFGEAEIASIKGCAGYLAPLVPAVVNAVYDKLFSFDITKAYFLPRMEGFKGTLAPDMMHLSQSSEQIKFRKDMLSKYLVRLVTGEYDANMVKYLDYVGKIHTSKAGSKMIDVDYVHVNALMGYVEDIIINAVMDAPDMSFDAKKAACRAFNKLLWLQNDLFVRHYLTAPGQAGAEGKDPAPQPTAPAFQLTLGQAALATAIVATPVLLAKLLSYY